MLKNSLPKGRNLHYRRTPLLHFTLSHDTLAWITIALALVPAIVTTLSIMRRIHRSEVAILVFLTALLFTQAAQLIFARRAFSGTIAFGTPLRRAILYYVCLLLVVAATLPNWYVPAIVRRENEAVDNLRKYSTAMKFSDDVEGRELSACKLSALAAPVEAGKIASSMFSTPN